MAQRANFHCDISASFATAFRNWREKRKIPLKKVAQDLEISIATVSAWERGKRFPTGRHFAMLVDYTGLPPCRLFCVLSDKCVPVECQMLLPKKP